MATVLQFPAQTLKHQEALPRSRGKKKAKVVKLPQISQKWLTHMFNLQELVEEIEKPPISDGLETIGMLARCFFDDEMERARVAIEAGRIEPGKFRVKNGKVISVMLEKVSNAAQG